MAVDWLHPAVNGALHLKQGQKAKRLHRWKLVDSDLVFTTNLGLLVQSGGQCRVDAWLP